ncbi:MAG TPA: pentapeptide repeat-containing protein, partial [Chitinophagales bacterium]|nr:pentapeptide repeat-containing protein [Chitinophagales bacterium]
MQSAYFENQQYQNENYGVTPLLLGNYENCIFNNCNFSDYDISGFTFIECHFIECNLSLVHLNKTAFRQVKFTNCKMLGLHFENCNTFSLEME